jgi:DNA-binding GntR family transcriptional regulator
VARSSLALEVARKLRREILIGNLKPGERILEHKVSALMRTSRGPVRDALLRLEHEGLVVREPNRSAVVASMTMDDVEEVCSLRLTLEMLALGYAMDRAQEDDLSRMLAAVALLNDCLAGTFTYQQAVDVDLQFHEELVKSAHHGRVLAMWLSIKPQIWFLIFSRNVYERANFEEAVRSHEELTGLIRRRQPEAGRANLKEHLDIATTALSAIYRKVHTTDGTIV